MTPSYDSNTGNLVIPVSQVEATSSGFTAYAVYDVYLIY